VYGIEREKAGSDDLETKAARLADDGKTPMYVAVDGQAAGTIAVADKSKEDSDEPRLLAGAWSFDRQILTEIHDRFYPDIYRYASYRLGDPSAAEDVAGEVFLRLLVALKDRRGPRTTLRGWLMGTASHIINDSFRRSYASVQTDLTEDYSDHRSNPADMVELGSQRAEVRAALRRLTSEQQHVLALRLGNGYSLEDTARTMARSLSAVKSLQLCALASLRRNLEVSKNE